jgi:AcrR family transcriptional regulator
MTKTIAKSQDDFVRDCELSPVGRRILRKSPEILAVRQIALAARKVFVQKGLMGASMDEIAKVAGVDNVLSLRYFRNKEELHRFVIETMIAQISTKMESPAVLGLDPPERIRTLVNTTFDFVLRNPEYPQLIQREMLSGLRTLRWMVATHHRPLHKRAVEIIREGTANGQFRTVDPDQMVFTIFGTIMFYFATGPLASQIWNRNVWNPRNVARRRRAVLDFLEHGLFVHPKTESKPQPATRTIVGRRATRRRPATLLEGLSTTTALQNF